MSTTPTAPTAHGPHYDAWIAGRGDHYLYPRMSREQATATATRKLTAPTPDPRAAAYWLGVASARVTDGGTR